MWVLNLLGSFFVGVFTDRYTDIDDSDHSICPNRCLFEELKKETPVLFANNRRVATFHTHFVEATN